MSELRGERYRVLEYEVDWFGVYTRMPALRSYQYNSENRPTRFIAFIIWCMSRPDLVFIRLMKTNYNLFILWQQNDFSSFYCKQDNRTSKL